MEVVIRVNLDDLHEKTILTNSVIDVALLGSNKEPISFHISWSYLDFPDGIAKDLL